ncbi:Excinuclease ABC subunit B [hydrothermal vent metagenome]|uniref:UvrABC system protein B n=1 Tax=hydrothermal vent metagenome TaxID=652676 RepID=A0A3B1DTY7_9ZZZZ
MSIFKLNNTFTPSIDQKKAIENISTWVKQGSKYQCLEGVTGSGKTFTMAKVIEKLQLPTLIMTHNKTLAAQLYSEFKQFFPQNHVEYFISYYDYYQPEAYLPRRDLFIEKDSSINEELERLRVSSTASLLSFKDVICVASVSAIYGLGDPDEYKSMVCKLEIGQSLVYKDFLLQLVDMGYKRNDNYFDRGDFRINGDVIDIFPTYFDDEAIRIEFFGDEIENIIRFHPIDNKKIENLKEFMLYASNQFIVSNDRLVKAVRNIEDELGERLNELSSLGKSVEYNRLKQRVEFDLEMIETTGMCKGIENYARHLADKKAGETPYTMLDYFESINQDYLLIVDESHVSLSQFRGMYAGDRSRKEVLVDYGFRLPSALDNRPLKFDEFINRAPHFLFISATPNDLEKELSKGKIAKQIIRPTGILDPKIEIIDSEYQVEKLFDKIKKVLARKEKVLVTTLTKKMSEELSVYYAKMGLKIRYLHSEIDSIERNHIIREFRLGVYDILVGINLLREGLDLPEVSLVAILDADKEGFLRSETALIQTMGRAARNVNGQVILFAKTITKSMKKAIDITEKRRALQEAFNKKHNITPSNVKRELEEDLKLNDFKTQASVNKKEKMPATQRAEIIKKLTIKMMAASKALEFEEAIRIRDEINKVREI